MPRVAQSATSVAGVLTAPPAIAGDVNTARLATDSFPPRQYRAQAHLSVMSEAVASGPLSADLGIDEFVEIVLNDGDDEMRAYIDRLRTGGTSAESLYLDLLAPAARKLGEMWSDDSCDFMEITIALGKLQMALRDLSQLFVYDRPESTLAGRVLLACVPGEQHSFGLFMVAEFFIRDGWGVRVGPPVSEADLLADVRAEWYDVVGFSLSCDSRLDHLKREIARVRRASRNPNVLIMAGGRVLNEQPDLLARIGADASALSADKAPGCARQMLAIS